MFFYNEPACPVAKAPSVIMSHENRELVGIYIRKAVRFLSKQCHLQPHFHSKGTTVKWEVAGI